MLSWIYSLPTIKIREQEEFIWSAELLATDDWAGAARVRLEACRRDNVTADAAGRIGIFPLDLPEMLLDAADSGYQAQWLSSRLIPHCHRP
jgi:hypothetical protein